MFRGRRPPRSRGMQRIKIARWPRLNPIGDMLKAKIVFFNCWTPNIDTGTSAIAFPADNATPLQMNDPYALITASNWILNAPRSSGAQVAAQQFRRYCMTGLKMKCYPRLVNISTTTTSTAPTPLQLVNMDILRNKQYVFMIRAGGQGDGFPASLLPIPFQTFEDRWQKSGRVGTADEPSKPVKAYWNFKKVWGPMPYTQTDQSFTGLTNPAATPFFSSALDSRPSQGPFMRMGITRLDGASNPTDILARFEVGMVMTMYMTYYDRFTVLSN